MNKDYLFILHSDTQIFLSTGISIPIASPSPFNVNMSSKIQFQDQIIIRQVYVLTRITSLNFSQAPSFYAIDQVYLDQANNIIYLNLDTTTIISDADSSNRITITNIQTLMVNRTVLLIYLLYQKIIV